MKKGLGGYPYSESLSSSENDDSYGDDAFGRKKNYGLGNEDVLGQQMSSTAGMYNLSKVKAGMFNNFGNSASKGFGNTGGMFGNLAKTGGFSNNIDDIYNIDLNTEKYKKEEEKPTDKKTNKKNKKKKGGFMDDLEDEIEKEEKEKEEDDDILKGGDESNQQYDDFEKDEKKEPIKDEKKEEEKIPPKKKAKNFMENLEDDFGTSNNEFVDSKKKSESNSIDDKLNEKKEQKKEDSNIEVESVPDENIKASDNFSQKEEKEVKEEKVEKENENNNNNAVSKNAMEEYMKKHNLVNMNNAVPQNEENEKSKMKDSYNLQSQSQNTVNNKTTSKKNANSEEDDDYGGFEDDVASLEDSKMIKNNKQSISNSLITQNKKFPNKAKNETSKVIPSESNVSDRVNKFLASGSGDGYSNNDFVNSEEIKDLEKDKSKGTSESLIKQVNEEHKKNMEEVANPQKFSTLNDKIISSNNINNNNNVNSLNSVNSTDVQNLIGKEINKYFQSENFKNLISYQNNNNINSYKNTGNFDQGNQGYITFNSERKTGRFNKIDLYIRHESSFNIYKMPAIKEYDNLLLLKKNAALEQEQKRRNIAEFELSKLKGINLELQKEIKNLQKLESDKEELIREKIENEKLIEKMKQGMDELRNEYDDKIKLIEQRINSRENKLNEHKINEIEQKYQMDLINKKYEVDQIKIERDFFANQYKTLEEENKKLKDNREFNQTLNELKKDNYILHEKINELEKQKESIEIEYAKLKLSAPESNNNTGVIKPNNDVNFNNNNLNKELNNKPDTLKIYEQLLNEREITTQENLLNNYLKEIERLNKEIYFLKTIPSGNATTTNQILKNNYVNDNNETVNSGKINENQGGISTLNNITTDNIKNKNINIIQGKNYQINPSLQESAEKQIKKLQNFLLPSKSDPMNNKITIMEKEFKRLQTDDNPNTIPFDTFISVMKNMQVPLSSSELMEIFNNFPRIKGNCIRMNDFINAMNSKVPSAFFMQSDPTYLNELEAKLIKSQNRIKELEKFILVNNNENEEFKEQIKKLTGENKTLKNKINDLNSQILQYFLYREEKNMSNPDVIQMKEKMKNFEIKNKNMNDELSEKFGKYEKKIDIIKKTYEDDRSVLLKEKDSYKEQINTLKNKNEKIKNDFEKKEIKYKAEIDQLNEKLQKYKKNYNIMINKNEVIKQEKERILNSFKDKGFDPDQIMTFVNSSTDIQLILKKVEDLERKNLNREEIYKKICLNINATQVNKELEKLSKKHEEEKRGLLKIIAQKNNELNSIKTEFYGIMTELEKMKATKFK